ncbi:MICOS complex subunit MIC27 isoform X2 [Coccinella septempunctata]|uniref:MICOS complex subunit MIC27 isoform X2 n=1 Tax=Coccinella septempunctata TaxID=41139 RepID=UPI001D084E32|nr:MICOS complex subunit MIC27 isoform X2 [Coccinella septempunctata]
MITSDGNSDTSKKGLICKPSELPIYSPDIPVPQCIEERPTWFGNFLQAKVSSLRQLIDTVVHEAKAYENVAEDYIKDGVDKADGALTYLRQENNTVPKVGAIAIGGLTGLILSLRKGFFKRTLYTAAGATVMTAICYPKQTSEYSQIGMREGKKYATIAYNFAYGVKKGDPPIELPSLPELPSSVSDTWSYVSKNVSSLFLDKADSDNKCTTRADLGKEDESDEELSSRNS